MKSKALTYRWLALTLLLAVALSACNIPQAPTRVADTPTSPPVVQNTPVTPPPQGDTLTREQRSYLAHVTVRIWGAQYQRTDLALLYRGSGSIISADGLILTNCHVANPVAMGYPSELSPDTLIVELVDREDTPPVPTYLATVLTFDPVLDLAVIKIDSKLDGTPVRPGELNLKYVPLGNSDEVQFGDPLFIFGFPGIGGDTITYSTGNISGFDSEQPVGNRAWIKTDATIAGGNSGGLASNSQGEIIGIPTQAGTGSAQNATDCRIIQDTNGDGTIDNRDTCIPIGGFINGIRPVNWALPLIQAAQSGVAYVSPYGGQTPRPTAEPPVTGDTQFSLVAWSEEYDNSGCPVNPVQSFLSGVLKINAVFAYQGLPEGTPVSVFWLKDGQDFASVTFDWDYRDSASCYPFPLSMAKGTALPDGAYGIEIYAGNALVAQAQTSVGKSSQPPGQGVMLSGQVTDANTGRGIQDIFVVVLKPGVDPYDWTYDPQEADVYSIAQTDAQGYYALPDPLQPGQVYGVVAGNNKIGYPVITGYLEVALTDTAINLPLELSK